MEIDELMQLLRALTTAQIRAAFERLKRDHPFAFRQVVEFIKSL